MVLWTLLENSSNPKNRSWELLIYSQSVRSTGNNLSLHLTFEVKGSLVGLNSLPVESNCISVDIDFVGVGSLHTHTHIGIGSRNLFRLKKVKLRAPNHITSPGQGWHRIWTYVCLDCYCLHMLTSLSAVSGREPWIMWCFLLPLYNREKMMVMRVCGILMATLSH